MLTTIKEAFETKVAPKGVVPFLQHEFKDPHIIEGINILSSHTGQSVQEIKDYIKNKVKDYEDMAQKAPRLFDTSLKNAIESEIFTKMWEEKIPVPKAPVFNATIFKTLFRTIQGEHPSFFPMKSVFNSKDLKENEPILVPMSEAKADQLNRIYKNKTKSGKIDYNQVNTAACYPSGQFVFNIPFMQSLLDFAFLKKLKPKGRKYFGNSGLKPDDERAYKYIPDEYGYIEFLIIHEFFHYTQDDFHHQKIIPKSHPKIINYVGDFRSNYLLVKSGYSQLPIGLYSDDINYDRQNGNYLEMYRIVKEELEKTKKTLAVGDIVKMPNGKKGIIKSITNGKAQVEPA